MSAVIQATSLSKTYGSRRALDDFSLEVPSGIIFGLLGPNGAGKTTAIEIMLGLRKSDSGTVKVLDQNPEKNFEKIAPRIGAMLQQGGINPGLKPREAVKLYSSFYPQSLDVDELIKLADLQDVSTTVRRLSGGQSQSLSLALAIIGKPELVFLDEPTVGMDPRARRRTWGIIQKLRQDGSTVILTTHLMDEAEMLCDEIAIVSKGKVIAQGDTATLTSVHHDAIEVEFSEPIIASELNSVLNIDCEQKNETSLTILTNPNSEILIKLATYALEKNLTIVKYSSQAKNLEDVFIELTGDVQ